MLMCSACGVDVAPRVSWQQIAGGRRHIRAECPRCGGYLKFLPQTPENVALADAPRVSSGPGLFDDEE